MITVLPLAMRLRLALTIASLSASSALVASSRISTGGSISSARAMARRCRCPPERLAAPSSSIRVVAARQALDELLGARELRGAHDVYEARIRPGHRDVVADRAGEEEVLLRHDADVLTQVHEIDLAQIHAVDLDHALIAGVQALQQAGDGGLARAAAPHDAEHLAARNRE